ncbi:hypothetical protein TRFO_09665 [Tritrichomonas foetus]|uniref:Translin-associated factor X-interacting protein 1 N-terminal domain-containing protein n=1 Tax=Tritrichomonas foetus TaxID=1144522 RepID=A0A1J4JIR4_9EUKA|nr:hypothetical protein TRFO_09665 [Tritrichomonas foetus]|eukprot:OHS97100.1 hypothetical protein TRFO_09665 [Tritrichomonas foetus]
MTERIAPPSKPRTMNPRSARPNQRHQVPYSARAVRPTPPIQREKTFLEQIEAFLKKENAAAHSDADRVYVYKRAFEFLSNEFTLCKPLINRIKQQYDEMSASLLEKHREMIVDSSSVTQNEDQFSELVNKMRRSKAKEFKKCHEESEKLLDEMTDLRLQRSELLKQLEEIETQKRELKSVAAAHAEQLQEKNDELQCITIDVKEIEIEKTELSGIIEGLEDKIDKIRCSEEELKEKDEFMKNELSKIKKIEDEKRDILDDKKSLLRKLDLQVQDMNKDVIGLQREKKIAEERLESNKQRKENNEARIREMLLKYDKRPDVPIVDIVKKMLG